MKKIISIIALLLSAACLICSCGKHPAEVEEVKFGTEKLNYDPAASNLVPGGSVLRCRKDFKVPDNLMTTEEYQKEMDALATCTDNFTDITDDVMKKIDNLDLRLQDQIIYNTDDITECEGTHYYVSNEGNDENDGKTPETAWQTIMKVNETKFEPGDLVSFRRGDKFRGVVAVTSGVSYGAYGTGYKPQICASFDGLAWDWVKTDRENVWKLDHPFTVKDIKKFPNNNMEKLIIDLSVAVLVTPNGQERSGTRCYWLHDLNKDFEFCFCGLSYNLGFKNEDGDQQRDKCIYMYCSKGDPNELFTDIEIGVNVSVLNENNKYIENVKINNLEMLYGRGPIWPGDCKNVEITYCIAGWQGGYDDGSQGVPYGGGGGVWGSCDRLVWDHCYFFQQWDSGVSPQYNGSSNPVVNFKDFITTNCIFKGCKWTFEYWIYQKMTTEDKIVGMHLDYNICRDGGYGFNPLNRGDSAYVKTWGYENTCYDCSISHNIFDRAYSFTYELSGFEQLEPGTATKKPVDKFSLERMPTMTGNIHVQTKNKKFAIVHKGMEYGNGNYDMMFKYTKEDLQKFISEGFESNSLYLFCPKKQVEAND